MKKLKYGLDAAYTEGFNDGFADGYNTELSKKISINHELIDMTHKLAVCKSKLAVRTLALQVVVGILVVLVSCIAIRGCSSSTADESKPNDIAAQYECLVNPDKVSVVTKQNCSYVIDGNVVVRNVGTGDLRYEGGGWLCPVKFAGFNYRRVTDELRVADGDQIEFYTHGSESGFVQFDFNDVTYNVIVKRGNSCVHTLLLCWKSDGRKIVELPEYPYKNAFIWASESFRDKSYFGTEELGTVDIDGQAVTVKMKVLKVDSNVRIGFVLEKNA